MEKKSREDLVLLLVIVAFGAVLRLVHFPHIPFMFDELSAVNRLSFDSFHDLIEKGIRNDGHPAGVHVFLYYWAKLFGTSEAVIKLPFIFFGIASIPLAYLISKKWFSSATGLLVAACMATLQFPVTYSDLARPYSSGLFFSLLLVLCWTNYLFFEKRKLLNLAGFTISAALCAYNHYFSLLFAAIVGATGLFFLTKRNYKGYLLACVGALLLFAPHLQLFFVQYGTGGLEWLGKPKRDFLSLFVQYIFHYSPWVIASVLLLSMTGIVLGRDTLLSKNRLRFVSITWFLLPLMIGFVYSVQVKPVLQSSVLIFSFPYLLIFPFSFYNKVTLPFKAAAVTLVLLVNTLTLVYSRQHYNIFLKQPVEQFAVEVMKIKQNPGTANTPVILQTDSNYLNYYFKKHNFKPVYFNLYHHPPSLVQFRNLVSTFSSDSLVTCGIPLEYLNVVAEYYPYELYHTHGFTYSIYGFSKTQGQQFPESILYENVVTTPDAVIEIDSTTEWGPSLTIAITKDIFKNRHAIIDISFSFLADTESLGSLIVFEYKKDGETLDWRGRAIGDVFDRTHINEWQTGYVSVRLADFVNAPSKLEDAEIKIFLWNQHQENVLLKNMRVRIRQDDACIYGLFGRLD